MWTHDTIDALDFFQKISRKQIIYIHPTLNFGKDNAIIVIPNR